MTEAMHRVLIVEDDPSLGSVLCTLFEANGYRVVASGLAAEGAHNARLFNQDAVIADMGLPDGDGIDVIRAIRSWSAMPIIVLSARAAESQRLTALECGADDYVLKPFSAQELLTRVRAVSRRHVRGSLPMGILRIGETSIDLTGRTALNTDGRMIRLTPLEYRILAVLARHPERIVTNATLVREVWGPCREDSGSLRVCIANLRRKLEVNPGQPRHIITEFGLGYRLLVSQEAAVDTTG